jgi:type I restriction enzyme M protein
MNPLFLNKDGSLKTFDYAVANPPFSYKSWRNGFDPQHDLHDRFAGYGIPTQKGDYAFLLQILRSLKSNGKGAVILPHGVLFRGGAESEIRSNIVKRGCIKGIIGLPANLFYGTGIPACIIVLDKENAANRGGIFMIDASKGFVKDGNNNRLGEQDIRKIIDVFAVQAERPKYSRFVTNDDIQTNDYNLNIPRYIATGAQEDAQDIEGHLKGGIPNADIEALADYWRVCPALKDSLFKSSARSGYSELRIAAEEIKKAILSHNEFATFRTQVLGVFARWRKATTERLKEISTKDHPKAIIQRTADDLLAGVRRLEADRQVPCVPTSHDLWVETMQDDAYIITVDRWSADKQVVRLQKRRRARGLGGLEGRLIPVSLLIATCFAAEQKRLDELNTRLEQIGAQMAERFAGSQIASLYDLNKAAYGFLRDGVKVRESSPL